MQPKQFGAMKAKDKSAEADPADAPKLSGGPLLNAIAKAHLSAKGKAKKAPPKAPAEPDADDEGAPPKSGFGKK